jgi:putative ABC transport system permease protein
MIKTWWREFLISLRSLARAPLFTSMVVLTFGVGLGGTSALFSGVSAAYLQALPFPSEDRLVSVWQTRQENLRIAASMLNFLDWKEQSGSFERMAAYSSAPINVTGGREPQRVTAGFVTHDFFSVLGTPPEHGRIFSAEEFNQSRSSVVVISRSLAEMAFSGDPDPVGKTMEMEGAPFQVIGIMPRAFDFPDHARLWLPLPTKDGSTRSGHNYQVVARSKAGTSVPRAQAEMQTIAARLAQAYPEENGAYGIAVVPLREDLLGRSGAVLLLLLGAGGLVLLVGCANVINLLLARSLARVGETTVRLALGARRSAVVRPFVIESLLLAFLGGAFGLMLAFWASRTLSSLLPEQVLPPGGLRIDGSVLLFTFALTLGVGLLCGLAPATRASRADLRSALTAGARGSLGASQRGLSTLVTVEVALACVLLVGAGLLLRSARRLEAVDPGFDARGVALLEFSMNGLGGSRYENPGWRSRFFDQLLDRATVLPQVQAVGAITQVPLAGGSYNGTLLLDAPGRSSPDAGMPAHYRLIGGQYFQALRIPLYRGRYFSRDDRFGAPLVAVVNERMAHDIAPGGSAIGQRVKIPGMDGIDDWAAIVGIVGDVRHRSLARDPVPEIYFPYAQRPERTWGMTVVARGKGDPAGLARRVREEAKALDSVPVDLATMPELVDRQLAPLRFRSQLLGLFAAVALLLTAIGIFGVVSYTVERRNREVGIRMALGADRGTVRRLVVRRGMAPVLVGMAAGVGASFVLMRFLTSLAEGMPLLDPVTFGVVVLLLGGIAFLASYLPAVRASRIEPVVVLKSE